MPSTCQGIPPPAAQPPNTGGIAPTINDFVVPPMPDQGRAIAYLGSAVRTVLDGIPPSAWNTHTIAAEARDRDEMISFTATPIRCPCSHCTPMEPAP